MHSKQQKGLPFPMHAMGGERWNSDSVSGVCIPSYRSPLTEAPPTAHRLPAPKLSLKSKQLFCAFAADQRIKALQAAIFRIRKETVGDLR
jgi:hypothetical protein